jgi:hypothetical protein
MYVHIYIGVNSSGATAPGKGMSTMASGTWTAWKVTIVSLVNSSSTFTKLSHCIEDF